MGADSGAVDTSQIIRGVWLLIALASYLQYAGHIQLSAADDRTQLMP